MGTRAPQGYGTITIVGGGCYGRWYLQQLVRAGQAGAVTWKRLVAVDRDPACQAAAVVAGSGPVAAAAHAPPEVAGHVNPAPELVVAEWRRHFATAIADAGPHDAIVPSPLMPHLMVEWVMDRVRARFPGREVALRALPAPLGTPWEMANGDAPHYASFATWTCPVNCIEPSTCPHTRDARTWSLPETVATWVAAQRAAGSPLLGPFTFHCVHRAYGVGMFETARVREAGEAVLAAAGQGAVEALVGTASHCHGALARLVVGA